MRYDSAMTRFVLIVLDCLAGLTLLVCVVVGVVWVRSYFFAERFCRADTSSSVIFYWSSGRTGLAIAEVALTPSQMRAMNLIYNPPRGLQYQRDRAHPTNPDDLDVSWRFYGAVVDRNWAGARYRAGRLALERLRQWAVPIWMLAAVLAPAGVWSALRLRRRWQSWSWRGGNRCPDCGYDLRATPERCPECGREAGRNN